MRSRGRGARPPATMPEPTEQEIPELTPVEAAELLGYATILCESETLVRTELVLKEGSYFLLTDAAGNVAPPGACEPGLCLEGSRGLGYCGLATGGGGAAVLRSHAAR